MEFGQRSVRLPKTPQERLQWRRVVVILEHCPLRTIQTRDGFELLRERHRVFHSKNGTDPAQWRPDVVHQCLLHLLDSPLNRSGRLQVFLRTTSGVLVMVDPRLRVPRSMRLFEVLMARLLFRLKIRSTVNQLQLLRVVRNPVTDHLPDNTTYIRVERGGALENPLTFCAGLAAQCGGVDPTSAKPTRFGSGAAAASEGGGAAAAIDGEDDDEDDVDEDLPVWEREGGNRGSQANMKPIAFVVGGMSKGDVDVDYAPKERTVSFSQRPMSAAAVCSLLCHAFEAAWTAHDYPHAIDVFTPK
jgi:rRNA small subunit pseudouridine methyltransferase Nep1